MKFCFRYLPFVLALLLFNSCDNDIEILGDYEEAASVYALLDPNSPVQFIKINKVFTNPNSKAADVAKISDSLYFDTLSPSLIDLSNGARIPLFKANIALKDSGFFANSPNYLYVTTQRIFADRKYRLEFELPQSKKLISAETNIANTPFLTQPVNAFTKLINVSPTGTMPVQFQTQKNTKIYDAFLYFRYSDYNKTDSSLVAEHEISWKILRSIRSQYDEGNELMIQRIPGASFYNLLLTQIPRNSNLYRVFDDIRIELYSGNSELDTYISASTPSIGIVQKQSEYSNVSNGIGIFASRNTFAVDGIGLSDIMKAHITFDPQLSTLNFYFK